MGKGGRQEVGEAEMKRILFSKSIFQQCQQIMLAKPGADWLHHHHQLEKPLSPQAKPAISILYLDVN